MVNNKKYTGEMKRMLAIILSAVFCTLIAQAQEKVWHLVTDRGEVVELSKVSYLLTASTETFDIVCTNGTTISEVSGISLEEREVTGIKTVKTGKVMFSQIVNEQITISNAKAGKVMQILSPTGIVYISRVLTDGQNIINVSKLQSGTYLLKVGDTKIKFIKK